MPVWYTVDTGASRTVLSDHVFQRISQDRQPELRDCRDSPLEQAGGVPLIEKGVSEMDLILNRPLGEPLTLKIDVTVADIKDDVLLGLDAGEVVDVMTSRNQVVIDGQEVPCVQVKSSRIRKVQASAKCEIPACSEVILEATVEVTDGEELQGEVLIEPAPQFSERHSLILGSSLVKLDKTCMVRVMNPFDKAAVIHSKTVLGYAEPFESVVHQVVDSEDQAEFGNSDAVRRLQFNRPSDLEVAHKVQHLSMSKGVREQAASSVDGLHGAKEVKTPSEVPSHLQSLWADSVKDKTADEKQAVLELLCELQETFSKDDTDLGLTSIAEHCIDTGDAKPIKQAPRRVPMALAGEETKAIDQLLQQGVIQESCSPWASPIVLVKKKNGKIRPCVDYRKLNMVTKKDAFPIPRTQDCP